MIVACAHEPGFEHMQEAERPHALDDDRRA